MNNQTLNMSAITTTSADLITILLFVRSNGYHSRAVFVNGVLAYSGQSSAGSAGTLAMQYPIYFGRYGASSYPFYATMKDARIWKDVSTDTNLSVFDEAKYRSFITADGSLVHPDEANLIYGNPLYWLPANATDANAGVNRGTAGAFTVSGTF